jgi:hypothetical protein
MSESVENGGKLSSPGGFFSRLVGIFLSPKKVFSDVDNGAPWWEPWVWASFVYMIVGYLVAPIQIHLYRLREGQMPREEFEKAIETMQSFPIKYLGIISAPLTTLFVAVIFALVSYIAVSGLAERSSFKKHLTICLWGTVVWWLGVLVSTAVVRLKGIEQIRTVRDAAAPFGPAAFVSDANRIWFALLSTLDVFAIWFYVLVVVGVVHVFRLSGRSAVLIVIPIWLVYVLFELIGARMAGLP